MTSSKKQPSTSSSPLEGLLDLLIDLQIVHSPNEVNGESEDDHQETENQSNGLSSEVVNDDQNLQTDILSVAKPELTSLKLSPLREEQLEDSTKPSNESAQYLETDNAISAIEELQNIQDLLTKAEETSPIESYSEVNLNQSKKSEHPPELKLSQLINSYQHKEQPKEFTTSSITATDNQEVDSSLTLFERWQRLLMTQELMDSRADLASIKNKLQSLENQIYDPTELINLLVPLITQILSRKVLEAREEVAQSIAPIIDEMIQAKTHQDKVAMSSSLAPLLPDAVTQQVTNFPGDFAKALGPEMGTAIKEQITLERDAMVDALYPVIGSTVSKYFAEFVRSINQKVETTLSLQGISRTIRARIQGVSEAELIFRESVPFTVQAVFLIHKGSGLVIAEEQPLDQQRLESEMVAGMLTAIRSFVNDCIAQSGEMSEIDQIEYGQSKITLEVAGYCYLAVVTQGEPPQSFIQKTRSTLATIVQKHDKSIELFDGDPDNVPEQVHQLLNTLIKLPQTSVVTKKPITPIGLMLVSLAVFGTIFFAWGTYQYTSGTNRRIQEETSLALATDPELAVYRLMVEVNQGTIKLTGKLPNEYLRSKAEQIAKKVQPKLKIQNATIPVEIPADPVKAAAEVKRVTNILNQMDGAVITADYQAGKVTVEGAVLQESDAKEITQAFQQIPGVQSVTNTVQLQPLAVASRVYFEPGSSELNSTEISKITPIKAFLDQYPNKHLRLLGHTDPKGTIKENEPLALERATKVKDALIKQGIDATRLQVAGTTKPPLGVDAERITLLSRCVQFELITP